jgi:hypothetical protein
VKDKSKRCALDLLDRLPRGHPEIERSLKKFIQGLSRGKDLKEKGRLALSALERLVPKFPRDGAYLLEAMRTLESLSQRLDLTEREGQRFHKIQDRLFIKRQREFPSQHSEAPWISRQSAQDILWKLNSDQPKLREEARQQIENSFKNIGSPGHRLDFVIEVGVKGQSRELKQWKELQETLQLIRDSMDPMDVDLADLGIKARVEGPKAIADYVARIKPSEGIRLEQHLFETYLRGKVHKRISTAMVPGIVFRTYATLQKRDDVKFSRPETFTLPPYAEARARSLMRYLPEDLKKTPDRDIDRLYQLAVRGSATAAKGLEKVAEHSRLAEAFLRHFRTHPEMELPPSPKGTRVLSAAEKVSEIWKAPRENSRSSPRAGSQNR